MFGVVAQRLNRQPAGLYRLVSVGGMILVSNNHSSCTISGKISSEFSPHIYKLFVFRCYYGSYFYESD